MGITQTTQSAQLMAWIKSGSPLRLGFRVQPGRYLGFSAEVFIDDQTPACRPQIRTAHPFSANTLATAVPQLPAPTTAILKAIPCSSKIRVPFPQAKLNVKTRVFLARLFSYSDSGLRVLWGLPEKSPLFWLSLCLLGRGRASVCDGYCISGYLGLALGRS